MHMLHNSLVITILIYGSCIGLLIAAIAFIIIGLLACAKYMEQERTKVYSGYCEVEKKGVVLVFVWAVIFFIISICIDLYVIH